MNWMYLLYFSVFIALVVLVPPLVKRVYYQRMMNDLDKGNVTAFKKHLDSLISKVTFTAFERESMRLSLCMAMGDKKQVEDQLAFMENMKLSKKQKAQLGEQGFYIYLDFGKIKKAKRILDMVETYGTPQQFHNLEIQYSILLKKESKYIKELTERHSRLEEQGPLGDGVNIPAGMLEYLIALQYSYNKDYADMKKWLKPAIAHLKGTAEEATCQAMLEKAA